VLIASIYFLLFFFLVAAIYYALPQRYRWIWLLISSYLFYISWSIAYAFVLLIMTVVSYVIARMIMINENRSVKRHYLQLGVILSFGILGVFKYSNFFLSSFNGLLSVLGVQANTSLTSIFFPIGISFFTLQIIGYLIDVYNETTAAELNFGKYALSIAFFPKLISGPLERVAYLLPELSKKVTFNYDNFSSGMIRIGWGFWKKLVIADRLAAVTDAVFSNPYSFSGSNLAIAVLLYSLQIYADFSAYCDIVIGMAQILGIKLTENFNYPYFATSPIDFWRRWHITLSNWFRDYLFYPLNFASRRNRSPWVPIRNIMLVFLFSGLWHGANWTFIIWGGLHGLYQSVELALQRRAKAKKIKPTPSRWRTPLGIIVTFGLVTFAWIFFRANNVGDAFYIIKTILVMGNVPSETVLWTFTTPFERMVVIGLLLTFVLLEIAQYRLKVPVWEQIRTSPLPIRWTLSLILIYSVIIFGYYGANNPSAFIYTGF